MAAVELPLVQDVKRVPVELAIDDLGRGRGDDTQDTTSCKDDGQEGQLDVLALGLVLAVASSITWTRSEIGGQYRT